MPRYQVTLDGKTFIVEGSRPPSEAEARQAFSVHTTKQAAPAPSNAGMSTEQLQAANLKDRPDLPSAAGFAGNALNSAGRFVSDAVAGIPALAKMTGGALMAAVDPSFRTAAASLVGQNAPRMVQAAGQAVKQRYGGVDEALHTAYTDPVGMAADASTLAGGIGLAAKAGNAPRIARIASGVGEAVNPMRLITEPAAKLAHEAGVLAVKGTLRPSAALRSDFGGGRAIAEGVLKDRVYNEASATKKLGQSVAQADKMLADAEAAGAAGVPRMKVARAIIGEPQEKAKLRVRLGEADQTPELMDAAKTVLRNNPKEIPLTQAQTMKREAQKIAAEAGKENLSVKQAAQTAQSKALRAGIEDIVPEIAPVNERSQRLIGAKEAFAQAQDRPHNLGNMLSLLSGVATGGFAAPAALQVMQSPRFGAAAGIAANTFGQGMNANSLRKAALVSRLLDEQD